MLASLVPQLHERVHALEQTLAAERLWSPDNEPNTASELGPQWGNEVSFPRCIAPPDDEINAGVHLEQKKNAPEVKVGMEHNISDHTSLTNGSRRHSVPRVTDISRSKVKEMDEKTLDTQTSNTEPHETQACT